MGVVYLGDECIGEMCTSYIPNITNTVINVLKNPISRYIVEEDGFVTTIAGDVTGTFDDALTIGDYGLFNALFRCTGLTGSVSFPNLTSVGIWGLRGIFYECTGLTGSVSFPKLATIGDNGLNCSFYGCTKLTGSVSFPKLTSVGDRVLYNAFYNCTLLTEIHFRADMQATIEAQYGYSSKFGATNATIYFDL